MSKSKIARLNAHITRSISTYVAGTTLSYKQFRNRVKSQFPELASAEPTTPQGALKYLYAYATLNKVLAHRGLCIKASNYYTKFTILNTKDTSTKITSLYTKSSTAKENGGILAIGAKTYKSKWSPLTQDEITRISTKI